MEWVMAWTDIARREHSRAGLRYPTDMTDREWVLAAPFIPPAKTGGRRRTTDMREVLNAMLYLALCGCPASLLARSHHQQLINRRQQATVPPGVEISAHRRSRREAFGQHRPGHSRSRQYTKSRPSRPEAASCAADRR